MNLADLFIAKKLAGGGGGGTGTDNYNDLSNKPQINSTALIGDKSASDLGLQSEIDSDNKISADYVDDTSTSNKFVSAAEKLAWSGKQDAIDADHKIDADYVDDTTSDNKFVTASDKTAWNAKQNAIDSSHKLSSDLVDDTGHTNLFVTSTEKSTWSGKQDKIDSSHKLSSTLVSFDSSEAAALASGIDSSKVGQISTNQTNIWYALNDGVKNIFPINNGSVSSDGYLNKNNEHGEVLVYPIPAGSYKLKWTVSSTATNCAFQIILADGDATVTANRISVTTRTVTNTTTTFTDDITIPSGKTATYLVFYINNAGSVSNVMLCRADLYSQDSTYVPYALPNYDLTRLEAQDRAALAEEIDAGAKNKLDYSAWKTVEITNGTGIWENNGVTLTATGADCYTVYNPSASTIPASMKIPVKQGDVLVMSWEYEIASGITAEALIFPNGNATGSVSGLIADKQLIYTVPSGVTYVTYRVGVRGTGNVAKFKNVMICTKAAFGVSQKFVPFGNDPFYQVPINHNMIYRGQNLGDTLTDAQDTALSSGNFADLYLGDYWTKTVTIPAGTYTGGDGEEVTVPAQTNITLKAVIADFDTFYAGYASTYAGINTHHAAVIVTGFSNVVWNKTNSTAGGYVASLIHKWLVGSVLPQIETWFGSAKVLSHQKLLTNAITGDAASGWAWSSQKISLLSENQMYGSKVWGNSKAANGGYEPGEAFKHLNVFNHIDANLLFGNKNIWLRDIASAVGAAGLISGGGANYHDASYTRIAPAALILLS